ncbi:Tn3 family transposase [Sphaerisporangium sp. NBC_01403]|uniref:Tn3 family transposase n=1 Tax=Sphaerisporangium sp. NBC_01403 TaxID=2903599 RepID=UPI003244F0A0
MRLDEEGDLVISPLTAEDVPAEAIALKAELTEMLPFAPIVSLLIELDKRTGYLDCFTHAGGKQARSTELRRNLIAVLISHSTNLGLTRMADACGISYDVLAWTSEWYVREETLRAANLTLIGYHQRLPLIPIFGAGTLSSSDGQRFPTRGKSVTARVFRPRGPVDLHPCDRSAHPPTARRSSSRRTARPTTCWTRSWATRPTSRSPSTRPTPTG